MTRAEAAKKVEKARRLAKKAGTAEEADTAKRVAEKLIKDHGLTDEELEAGAKIQVFDELCDRLGDYVARHEVPRPVIDAIEKLKTSASEKEKKAALSKIVGAVRLASLFFGSDKTVAGAKKIIDDVLLTYEVKI